MEHGIILLVEDEAYIREIIGAYLIREGYRVVEATCGRQALELAAVESPDLVLLDIALPDMNGLDVCAELRREHAMPIVFVSRKTDPEVMIRGFELGGDDYVTKPFDPQVLTKRVMATLRRYRHAVPRIVEQSTVTPELAASEPPNPPELPESPDPPKLPESAPGLLTNRETIILELIAIGCTNEDIARKLRLSIGTVKWFNTQIFGKLNVKNRTQAIAKYNELRHKKLHS